MPVKPLPFPRTFPCENIDWLEAGDDDYRVFVIEDCCADLDTELHTVLLTRLFPKRAEVLSAADFVKQLG